MELRESFLLNTRYSSRFLLQNMICVLLRLHVYHKKLLVFSCSLTSDSYADLYRHQVVVSSSSSSSSRAKHENFQVLSVPESFRALLSKCNSGREVWNVCSRSWPMMAGSLGAASGHHPWVYRWTSNLVKRLCLFDEILSHLSCCYYLKVSYLNGDFHPGFVGYSLLSIIAYNSLQDW